MRFETASDPIIFELGVAAGTHFPRSARKSGAFWFPSTKKTTAEFFADVGRIEGANVRAFSEFEGAMTGLIMREISEE